MPHAEAAVDNGLIVEAARFATKWLQDATSQASSLTRAYEQCISNQILERLLINLDDKSGVILSPRKKEAAEARSALEQARKDKARVVILSSVAGAGSEKALTAKKLGADAMLAASRDLRVVAVAPDRFAG